MNGAAHWHRDLLSALVKFVLVDAPPQGLVADAQGFGCFSAVPLVLFERLEDLLRRNVARSRDSGCRGGSVSAGCGRGSGVGLSENEPPLDGALQLADVAAPVALRQLGQLVPR